MSDKGGGEREREKRGGARQEEAIGDRKRGRRKGRERDLGLDGPAGGKGEKEI